MDDGKLVNFAAEFVGRFVEAVNRGDRVSIRAMSVLGIQSDGVVSRYCEILEAARPVRVLSISATRPVERNRYGPRWAPWVVHDQVRLDVVLDCATGRSAKEILVWLYRLETGLDGQLASILIIGFHSERA